MEKNSKQRLFEIMNKLNPEFTGKKFLNETTNINSIIDGFRKKKRSFEMVGDIDGFYDMITSITIPQLERIISGDDFEEIKQYYPDNFTDEDFKMLINTLKQPEFSGNIDVNGKI